MTIAQMFYIKNKQNQLSEKNVIIYIAIDYKKLKSILLPGNQLLLLTLKNQ